MSVGVPLPQDVDFSKLVFLVVDDKPFYREMAHTAVMRARAKDVKQASSVETALQLLNRLGQAIDCVIVDWDIAPEGGLELLRKIRAKQLPRTPQRMPVVILTGKADAAAVKAAKALDVNGFAVAPLSIEKLAKTIGNAIQRAWTPQDPSHYAAIPLIAPTQIEPEKPKGIGGPARVVKRNEQIGADGAPQPRASHGSHATAAAAQYFRDAELKNVRECLLNEVKAGAVLARDLRDKSGKLLLKSGTELKPALIERLTNAGRGEAYQVWVGEWDQPQPQ